MPPRSSSVRSMIAMSNGALLLDRDDRQLVCPVQCEAFGQQIVERPEYGVVKLRLEAVFRDRQRPVVLVSRLDQPEPLEHREDDVVRVELVDRRILLVRLDRLASEAVHDPHPRRAPVKMADHRAAAGLQDAPHFGNGPGRVARRMQYAVRPDGVESLVREGQREGIADANFLRVEPRDLEVLTCDTYGRLGQVDCRDPHAAFQELRGVEPHPAADFEQVLARKRARFAIDALHDPGKLAGVHPPPDVVEELARAGHERMIADVLQAQRVPVPVAANLTDPVLDVAAHVDSFDPPVVPARIPITRAGTPATTEPAPKLRVTTAPAPTTVPRPRWTPSMITAPAPIQQSGPISTPARGAFRSASGSFNGLPVA